MLHIFQWLPDKCMFLLLLWSTAAHRVEEERPSTASRGHSRTILPATSFNGYFLVDLSLFS